MVLNNLFKKKNFSIVQIIKMNKQKNVNSSVNHFGIKLKAKFNN
jgi:hypothetical protein